MASLPHTNRCLVSDGIPTAMAAMDMALTALDVALTMTMTMKMTMTMTMTVMRRVTSSASKLGQQIHSPAASPKQ
jgi:hypothetical protein